MRRFGVAFNTLKHGQTGMLTGLGLNPRNRVRSLLAKGRSTSEIAICLGWTERKVRFLVVDLNRKKRAG